jgi:hypothetical protein
MRVTVLNFKGVRKAEIDLSKLALVAGSNASGKSSIALAIAAALSGEVVPIDGLRKTDAGMLVHAGTGKGTIEVMVDGGSISVTYPQAKVKTEGTPPAASPYALGLRSLLALGPKEAAAVLIEYLKAAPVEQDVLDATARLGLELKQAQQLWQKIRDLGWDGAHLSAKETGIKLKGQWEGIAGERYGPAKAESWLPKGWETGLEAASEESLQAALTQAREFLEAAIAATAVSAAEREQLQLQAAQAEPLQAQIAEATARRPAVVDAVRERWDALHALPKPSAEEKGVPCPHCSELVVVRGGTLAKLTPVDAAENARRTEAIKAATTAHVEATKAMRELDAELNDLKGKLRVSTTAADRLSTLPAEPTEGGDVERAREGVQHAEHRLAAFKAKRGADRLHHGIGINAELQSMLAADGLRLTKLKAAIRSFNADLARLCTAAGWGTVELSDSLEASYDGKPLVLLSASERFRAMAVVQVAMATIDRSAALVIDAADILDRGGRNGLMRLVAASAKPALICMTMPARAEVPRLGSRGAAYWLDGGVAETIEDARAE